MKKVKIILGILVVGILVIVASGIVTAAANDQAGQRVYVSTSNSAAKAILGVNHEFPNGFSTEVSPQLKVLSALGLIKTEEVQLYHITKKPGCACNNNGVCEPELEEHPSCCDDCKGDGEEQPPERSCSPSVQKPLGILKVNGGSGGTGVTVAVLDTGANTDHLDLKANVIDCKDATKRGIKNGCADRNGHGTHVSGTILADGGSDGLGIYGVAPEAKLMAIKVCGPTGCWSDDIAAGIDYAASHGTNIISMSLGGDTESSLVRDAIARNPGVLYVAAAGNDGPADGSIDYPGANAKVMAVGAIYYKDYTETFNWGDCIDIAPEEDQVVCWSSRGVNDTTESYVNDKGDVEFGAPGVAVESTWNNGCYNTISGTSMATPHVAGLAAKLWQGSASLTRTKLQELAELHDLHTEGDDTATGFGLPIAQ